MRSVILRNIVGLSCGLVLAGLSVGKGAPANVSQIRGTVSGADGQPQPGLRVRASGKSIRAEQLLGESVTDANGMYLIKYSSSQLSQPDGKVDAVVLSVFSPGGELLEKKTLLNPGQDTTANISIPAKRPTIDPKATPSKIPKADFNDTRAHTPPRKPPSSHPKPTPVPTTSGR